MAVFAGTNVVALPIEMANVPLKVAIFGALCYTTVGHDGGEEVIRYGQA